MKIFNEEITWLDVLQIVLGTAVSVFTFYALTVMLFIL